MTTAESSGAPVTAADITDTVIQTVRLLCGHEFRYRITERWRIPDSRESAWHGAV
ncbi:hypothetical protein [Amycolatopsis orientalis]|uniref:hypothetical protein n=1 Tax=Amycolatopsis orientalis TaxID=31958 RepID=UPI00039F762B|nr:hypothetical protein [Amycolatopsis orientalis]